MLAESQSSDSVTGHGNTGVILGCQDVGSGWPREHYDALIETVQQRLRVSAAVSHEKHQTDVTASVIEQLVQRQVQQITFLPFSLLPFQTGRLSHLVDWSRRQWPELQFQVSPPLSWGDIASWMHHSVLTAIKPLSQPPEKTALILCGQGTNDPLLNADLARLAHLLQEQSRFFRVSSAFLAGIRPTVQEVLESACREPVESIVLVPWQLTPRAIEDLKTIHSKSPAAGQIPVHPVELQLNDSALVNLLVANFLAASPIKDLLPAETNVSGSPLTEKEQFELQQLRQRIDSLLPDEYQGRFETVSPRSMGTAKLKTSDDGQVAWDQIWTSFCDLALAGGPPHRGRLLEAVTSEEALSDPAGYRAVTSEIQRGIQMVTHLKTFDSPVAGWVGIQCDSEEMAVWLMRAIIVENVMVRREGTNLFLPAGPRFTVAREIKNVITTIAKTVHYWSAHLKSRQQGMR